MGVEGPVAAAGFDPTFFAMDFGVAVGAVGGAVGVEAFVIASVLAIAGVVVVPGEGADGEGESVGVVEDACHFGEGVDGEGLAVAVFFFLTSGGGFAVEVDAPEEAALFFVPLLVG